MVKTGDGPRDLIHGQLPMTEILVVIIQQDRCVIAGRNLGRRGRCDPANKVGPSWNVRWNASVKRARVVGRE